MDTIVYNFIQKSSNIIISSRSKQSVTLDSKINKWFNLYISTISSIKEVKSSPIIIEVYIDLKNVQFDQLKLINSENKEIDVVTPLINSNKKEIMLERWLIEFDQSANSAPVIDEIPIIYKQIIILLRSIYGFLRVINTYKLIKSCDKDLSIKTSVLYNNKPTTSKYRIGLSKKLIHDDSNELQQKAFSPITTPTGSFKISVAYRNIGDYKLHITDGTISNSNTKELSPTTPQSVNFSRESSVSLSQEPSNRTPTPIFSSSFGSRTRKQSHPLIHHHPSYLNESTSLNSNFSDDDINDFVRMIDSKSDLRLSGNSNTDASSLNRYQMMKFQHQQLSDSVSQSIILQNSRKSSLNSTPNSYDKYKSPRDDSKFFIKSRSTSSNLVHPANNSSTNPGTNILIPHSSSIITNLNRANSSKITNSSSSNIVPSLKSPATTVVVSGLATSPSVYDYRRSDPKYENVFDDDDEDEVKRNQNSSDKNQRSISIEKDTSNSANTNDNDDDDLLFTMSDMNLK